MISIKVDGRETVVGAQRMSGVTIQFGQPRPTVAATVQIVSYDREGKRSVIGPATPLAPMRDEIIPAPSVAPMQDEVSRACALFERVLAFVPSRIIPRRVQTEVIGDGRERIALVVHAGGSKRALGLVYAGVFLTILGEIVRYWAGALKGGKASK